MENKCCEEGKVGCCENKDGGMVCCHSMSNCCKNWKKCKFMKIIFFLIILSIAFHMGVQWGEIKCEKRGGERFERGGMMNWGYGKNDGNKEGAFQQATGTVTVEVAKPTVNTAPKQ